MHTNGRKHRCACFAAVILCVLAVNTPITLSAQSAQTYLAAADAELAGLRLRRALELYEQALAVDSLALVAARQASLTAVTLGEFDPSPKIRDSLYALATRYARRAIAINPKDADAHYLLARALGRTALTVGVRARARLAVEIRDEALKAMAFDSNHAGARHIIGLWHQNVMQLSSLQRFAARTLMGAKALSEASWEEAQRNLEMAVALEPNAIVHRLDLGRLYAARKLYGPAREQLEWVLAAPSVDYNDDAYRREAEAALAAMRGRLQ